MLQFSEETLDAIEGRDGGPIEIEDQRTRRIYVVVAKDDFQRLVEEQLRKELQVGFDQADAGEVEAWDIGEILDEAHRRHANRSSQ